MPAKYDINKAEQVITISWEGEANNYEFIEALKKYQSDIRGNSEYDDFNELLDFCGVNGSKLTSKGLLHVAQMAAKTDRKEHPIKMAIVVNTIISHGFAKIYETYRRFNPRNKKIVRIFRSRNEALSWLKAR
ncbi:MAG: hypothetical protein OQK78_08175 [Gammaproteobacteria bacterium]|nr:hypothetical protein [Gammaproteobacteria bacterium]